jgi:sigma-B regulation protein RsbU (phosphoserine phosphatase)
MRQGKCLVNLRFAARADQLKEIRKTVRRAAAGVNCEPEIVDSIVLAVNEACMNIIQHAYGPQDTGEIILEILKEQNELTVRLTDFAEPIDPATCRPRRLDELRPGGLGTHFMSALMDDVQYLRPPSGPGNILVMKKKIPE